MKAGDERATPQWFFNLLNKRFRFTLDVAASEENAKCKYFFTKEDNGLTQSWGGHTCFMNPPWGRGQLEPWCLKAIGESRCGNLVVGIVPHDTSTAWWGLCEKGTFLWLPRKRIHFPTPGEKRGSPTFPIAVVVWHGLPLRSELDAYKEKA